jgi:hypothetical protein
MVQSHKVRNQEEKTLQQNQQPEEVEETFQEQKQEGKKHQ